MPDSSSFTILMTLAGGAASGIVGWGICKLVLVCKEQREIKSVLRYMRQLIPLESNWLTTTDIANNTQLSNARVEDICSRHPNIVAVTGMGGLVWGLQDVPDEDR